MDEETIEKYFKLLEMVQYDLDVYGIKAAHTYVENLVKTRPVSEQVLGRLRKRMQEVADLQDKVWNS